MMQDWCTWVGCRAAGQHGVGSTVALAVQSSWSPRGRILLLHLRCRAAGHRGVGSYCCTCGAEQLVTEGRILLLHLRAEQLVTEG
jgi:hypothetical protein